MGVNLKLITNRTSNVRKKEREHKLVHVFTAQFVVYIRY